MVVIIVEITPTLPYSPGHRNRRPGNESVFGSVQHVAEFLREFDGGGSDETRRLFPDPDEDVGDAVEDVDVLRVQHSLRQLVLGNVDLGQFQVPLAETHLKSTEGGRRGRRLHYIVGANIGGSAYSTGV